MIREAILLAGGLGTRLRSAVPDLPKCLAPVNGRPFIAYVTDYFRQQGIGKFIFALGYKSDHFDDFFRESFPTGGYTVSLEEEPLGTGGAIRQACTLSEEKTVLILNGDTFFRIGLAALSAFHEQKQADCSLSLKPLTDFDRFGVVELDDQARVRRFREKQYYREGLINGGIYALDRASFLHTTSPGVFSFEKDYLEPATAGGAVEDGATGTGPEGERGRRLFGLIEEKYFIDIGIPADYRRVQEEFKELS